MTCKKDNAVPLKKREDINQTMIIHLKGICDRQGIRIHDQQLTARTSNINLKPRVRY